jgi:1-acyl-sn-glycerol-3-phosphate acyltransferase
MQTQNDPSVKKHDWWVYGLNDQESNGIKLAFQKVGQFIVCGTLALVSYTVTNGLNSTRISQESYENFQRGYFRSKNQGLITYANHVCVYDDPAILAPFTAFSWYYKPEKLRYTLCATDRCFSNPIAASILRYGRVLPIDRKAGIDQPFLMDVIERLNQGQWVHMFPEGTRNIKYSENNHQIQPFKLGLAKMIVESKTPPVVLPIFHSGLHTVTNGVGNRIDIVVGEPIDSKELLDEIKKELKLDKMAEDEKSKKLVMIALSNTLQERLNKVRSTLIKD